jgi:ABC-type multidrug transport system fused ATPase/permease subunit
MKSNIQNTSLVALLLRLWRHNSKHRQRQFYFLFCLTLVSAFAEIVSLGAVLPFLSVLTAPEKVFSYPLVASFARAIGIDSASQLVLPLTLCFAAAAVVAAGLRMLLLGVNNRLAFSSGADLSMEMYRRTLYQPYQVHLSRNSSEVITGITSKVLAAVTVLTQFMTLMSSLILLVVITLALMGIDPVVAITATLWFGLSYAVITKVFRRALYVNSKRIAHEQTQVVKALQEGLGGVRDVLLEGAQPLYCEIYRRADQPLRRAQSDNAFISQSPRYAMEAVGMVLIAFLAYGLSRKGTGFAAELPILGALALGAQRLLPALQQGYSAWTNILACQVLLVDALDLLDQPLAQEMLLPPPAPLNLVSSIRFEAVSFRYHDKSAWVLKDLNLTILKGSRTGFVGTTGSGKSTTLDLLMGLLLPTKGYLLVDGEIVSGHRLRAWQRTIAHVPQSVYLADASLAENIAFGVPVDDIDMERVRIAARKAQISEFIESSPNAYAEVVGERGVRLSGGQRQRIGIARALYKQAQVLIFDEATSALDSATERSVMDAIEGLDHDLTILIIAHRFSTLQQCDTIIELANGLVVSQGTYDQLIERSPRF